MEIKNLWDEIAPMLHDRIAAGLHPQTIADYCNVGIIAVKSWNVDGSHQAQGYREIRLWHLLMAAGAHSPSFDAMPPLNRFVSQLYGYKVLDEAGILELLGISAHKHVTPVLRGHVRNQSVFGLDELEAEYSERLQEAISNLVHRLKSEVHFGSENDLSSCDSNLERTNNEVNDQVLDKSTPPPFSDAEPKPRQSATILTVVTPSFDVGVVLATVLGGALPLANQINSDECTPEDRSRFRSLLGEGVIFELSNVLNALCSEQARKMGR